MQMKRVSYDESAVVPLDDLKRHLRVSGDDSDTIIASLERAAVSYLDGYRGAMGRCINEQTWEWTVRDAGTYHLPLPDVEGVTGATWDGSNCVVAAAAGPIQITCKLPEDKLDTVKAAICIWVQIRYDGLEGASAVAFQAAFDALVQSVRWMR